MSLSLVLKLSKSGSGVWAPFPPKSGPESGNLVSCAVSPLSPDSVDSVWTQWTQPVCELLGPRNTPLGVSLDHIWCHLELSKSCSNICQTKGQPYMHGAMRF